MNSEVLKAAYLLHIGKIDYITFKRKVEKHTKLNRSCVFDNFVEENNMVLQNECNRCKTCYTILAKEIVKKYSVQYY